MSSIVNRLGFLEEKDGRFEFDVIDHPLLNVVKKSPERVEFIAGMLSNEGSRDHGPDVEKKRDTITAKLNAANIPTWADSPDGMDKKQDVVRLKNVSDFEKALEVLYIPSRKNLVEHIANAEGRNRAKVATGREDQSKLTSQRDPFGSFESLVTETNARSGSKGYITRSR